MAQIGINAWVWTSPVTTAEFGRLAPLVKKMGFDLIEFGVEARSNHAAVAQLHGRLLGDR